MKILNRIKQLLALPVFQIPSKRSRQVILRPKGNFYDLQEIYHLLNEEYFDCRLDLRISWFGKGISVPRTRMVFGSYDHRCKLIKVNRLLDRKNIPEYFIRFIVYHEMLHEALPPKGKKNGRRCIHHQEFKEKEKQFEHFTQAQGFLKEWKNFY